MTGRDALMTVFQVLLTWAALKGAIATISSPMGRFERPAPKKPPEAVPPDTLDGYDYEDLL